MLRIAAGGAALLLVAVSALRAADGKYTLKSATLPVPKDLNASIARLLSDRAVEIVDGGGAVLCDLWFRKELPVKAPAAQLKSGLTYRDVDESTIFGAIRFAQPVTDYRKQKIKPGLYTLRLGFQPMDGDHMGTAPYSEFLLVSPAFADGKPDTMPTKELQEMSAKATGGSHPGVFLLCPNEQPEASPKLTSKDPKTWVLNFKLEATAGGEKGPLGVGLTVVGHTEG